MDANSFFRLLLLAAIWGGSFLFMRVAVPVLGPVWLIAIRVGVAAAFLLAAAMVLRKPLQARAHWRHYAVIGFFNCALPFVLFAFAARTLPASLMSILNALAPIWGALVAAVWTRRLPGRKVVLGLLLGMAGVALLMGLDHAALRPGAGWAIAAAVTAPLCYGIATAYTRAAPRVDAFSNAHGSMWAATLMLLPALPLVPPLAPVSAGVLAAVLALGLACTGVAYLMYFRLIADIGAAPALTVTFLIPVFGVLWGALFLGEPVGWHTAAGAAIVLAGVVLVTGLSPRALWAQRAAAAAAPGAAAGLRSSQPPRAAAARAKPAPSAKARR